MTVYLTQMIWRDSISNTDELALQYI